MGVDVDAVAGWGVEIPKKLIKKIKNQEHDRLEDVDDLIYQVEELFDPPAKVEVLRHGSSYSGDETRVIASRHENAVRKKLDQINELLGTTFTESDVKWICEVHWW